MEVPPTSSLSPLTAFTVETVFYPWSLKMKTLAEKIVLNLAGQTYVCDILLAAYHMGKRPSILLCESRPSDLPAERAWFGEPIAVASTNAPPGYLQHLPLHFFTAKNYSENEGLWEQLELLRDEHDDLLFPPTPHMVTLGFTRCRIYSLSPWAISLFEDVLTHLPRDYKE
jgi:hypothetical protein